jgi:hypothetical protein
MSDGSSPALLAAFVAGALGVVDAVAWLGRTQSPWLVAVAALLMLALLARLGVELARLLDDRSRQRTGRILAGFAALAILAAAAPFARPAVARDGDGTPVATVRGYLTAAAVDGDGVSACRYLSRPARTEFERASGQTCESFFGFRTVRIGGEAIESSSQLAAAHYTVRAVGRDRLVMMTYAGQPVRFLLTPATATERQEYLAPSTPWRIASNVTRVV